MIRRSRPLDRIDSSADVVETATSGELVTGVRVHDYRRWFMPAIFVLAAIVLLSRLAGQDDLIERTLTYPIFLKAAMRAAAGRPFDTTTLDEVLPRGTPAGFQARAMGVVTQAAGYPMSAERWLIYGLEDSSSGYLAQFELCLLYWNEGKQAKAREACRNTRASADYWLYRGYDADQNGNLDEALAYYQMAASTDPDLIAAWHQLGRALFASDRHNEAVLAFEHVLALNEAAPADVFNSLSLSYLALGNLSMARDVLERGLSLYPEQRTYYLNMAKAFRAEGNLEAADDWYARLLERWPRDAQGWANRGETAMIAGRSRDAADYFQETVKIQPDDVGYWVSLATAAGAEGNISLAVTAYSKAMELRPDNAALWLQSGRSLVEAGREEEAITVLEHVLELEPANDEATSLLAGLRGETP